MLHTHMLHRLPKDTQLWGDGTVGQILFNLFTNHVQSPFVAVVFILSVH